MHESFIAIKVSQEEKRKTTKVAKKGSRKKSDPIQHQYTNACKWSAN